VSVTGFNQRRRELAAQQEAAVKTLDDMTYNELRALAKEKGINGYNSKKNCWKY
jgi:hypothetical protein